MTSNLKILQKLSDITKITAAKDGFSVVLISQSNDDMRPLIRQLIEKNCRYFVCVGREAEILHDFVDDCTFENENYEPTQPVVMTVWMGKKESIDDIAFYFSKTTSSSTAPVEYIVALMNDDKYEIDLIAAVQNEFR